MNHTLERCVGGLCSHAVSPRNPCRCERCDEWSRDYWAKRRADHKMAAAAANSEITPRFLTRTLERFDPVDNPQAYELACAIVEDPTRGGGFWGPPGLGKSHLAGGVVNACTAKGVAASYVGVEDLLARLRSTYGAKLVEAGETQIIGAYARCPVLALDDLGHESLSDWTVRTMKAIVNRRYDENLPLIVTSNWSLAELCARPVGRDAEPKTYRATLDRLSEMTGAWVGLSGRSRR